jgi:hypothetical protein
VAEARFRGIIAVCKHIPVATHAFDGDIARLTAAVTGAHGDLPADVLKEGQELAARLTSEVKITDCIDTVTAGVSAAAEAISKYEELDHRDPEAMEQPPIPEGHEGPPPRAQTHQEKALLSLQDSIAALQEASAAGQAGGADESMCVRADELCKEQAAWAEEALVVEAERIERYEAAYIKRLKKSKKKGKGKGKGKKKGK